MILFHIANGLDLYTQSIQIYHIYRLISHLYTTLLTMKNRKITRREDWNCEL